MSHSLTYGFSGSHLEASLYIRALYTLSWLRLPYPARVSPITAVSTLAAITLTWHLVLQAQSSVQMGTVLPRERQRHEYQQALVERYKHLPEVKRITRHRHLPTPIYKVTSTPLQRTADKLTTCSTG